MRNDQVRQRVGRTTHATTNFWRKTMTEKQTHWIVELEEDPESGDLMMPLPPEMLKDLGWNIGDTLTWKIDETGEISLTKQTDEKQ